MPRQITVNAGELGPQAMPMVNSAPTTPGSMKSGFSCYCNNTSTAYRNLYFIWISVNCWCIIAIARKTWFHWARCCRGRVYHAMGAEFSRIYTVFQYFICSVTQCAIGGSSSLPLRCHGCRFTRNHCACAPML